MISTELRIWKIEIEFFSLWDLQAIFRGLPNVMPNFTSPDIKIWDMGNVRGILSLKFFLPSLTNFHVKRSFSNIENQLIPLYVDAMKTGPTFKHFRKESKKKLLEIWAQYLQIPLYEGYT